MTTNENIRTPEKLNSRVWVWLYIKPFIQQFALFLQVLLAVAVLAGSEVSTVYSYM